MFGKFHIPKIQTSFIIGQLIINKKKINWRKKLKKTRKKKILLKQKSTIIVTVLTN